MLYSNPTKVFLPEKYNNVKSINARMAVWFDTHFFVDDKDRDDETCYKYLYLTYYMLGNTKHYFNKYDDTDKYAQFCASTIFLRLLRKQRNGEVIKSILNYAKKTCYPLKVMYQKQEFNYVLNPTVDEKFDTSALTYALKDSVQTQYNEGMERDILDTFNEISSFVHSIIDDTPYKNDEIMHNRLYLSCMMSFVKGITLSKYNKDRIDKRNEKDLGVNDNVLAKMFNKERETSITLWRLDDSMKDYVKLLVDRLRQRIVEEITYIRQSYTLSDDLLSSILATAWESSVLKHHNCDEEDD